MKGSSNMRHTESAEQVAGELRALGLTKHIANIDKLTELSDAVDAMKLRCEPESRFGQLLKAIDDGLRRYYEVRMRHLVRTIKSGAPRSDVRASVDELLKLVQNYGAPTLEKLGTNTRELTELVRTGYISRAKKSLRAAQATIRRGKATWNDRGPMEDVQKYTRAAGATLEEIGITESAYKNLRHAIFELITRHELKRMRKGEVGSWNVRNLLQALTAEGLTLEVIGSSESEIKSLMHKKSLQRARYELRWDPLTGCNTSALHDAIETGVSLEELGLTSEEFAMRQRAYAINTATSCLKGLREHVVKIRQAGIACNSMGLLPSALVLRSALSNMNMQPEDIGTSAEELKELDRVMWDNHYKRIFEEYRKTGRVHGMGHHLKNLSEHGFKPSDFGLSELELSLLEVHMKDK